MAIPDGYRKNFETLLRAAQNGDLALVECVDQKTHQSVMAVCAISRDKGEYVLSPLAKLFGGNSLIPPNKP